MTTIAAEGASSAFAGAPDTVGLLPDPDAWLAAAAAYVELFAPLAPGVRVALIARAVPATMLVWHVGETGVEARTEAFTGYASSAADILLSADEVSLRDVHSARAAQLFEVLRAGVRSGHIVCYVLKRRCVLEERGLDDLLDALGFAFMGACR